MSSNSFKLEWRGPQVSAAVKGEGSEGVRAGLEKLLAASNDRVPVDTGELKGSGSVVVEGLEGAVTYSAEHAVVVHENLEAQHPDGQVKFLEAALQEEQDELLAAIAERLKAALK